MPAAIASSVIRTDLAAASWCLSPLPPRHQLTTSREGRLT
ncbi:hypothetical protein TcasGA2_TC001530 [Tribolium castaneum]|uniref:Uncharacterized protein n=1 Tax=Tribolium castaneum TaxID=7070 RepID=D7EI46_TRICA|nr:hypothetical protein TcasGA2_TC001530 [Tribolium castaneum]